MFFYRLSFDNSKVKNSVFSKNSEKTIGNVLSNIENEDKSNANE